MPLWPATVDGGRNMSPRFPINAEDESSTPVVAAAVVVVVVVDDDDDDDDNDNEDFARTGVCG